jgi:hypothetical protein
MAEDLAEFVIPPSFSFPVNYRVTLQRLETLPFEILFDLPVYHHIYCTAERFLIGYGKN